MAASELANRYGMHLRNIMSMPKHHFAMAFNEDNYFYPADLMSTTLCCMPTSAHTVRHLLMALFRQAFKFIRIAQAIKAKA